MKKLYIVQTSEPYQQTTACFNSREKAKAHLSTLWNGEILTETVTNGTEIVDGETYDEFCYRNS